MASRSLWDSVPSDAEARRTTNASPLMRRAATGGQPAKSYRRSLCVRSAWTTGRLTSPSNVQPLAPSCADAARAECVHVDCARALVSRPLQSSQVELTAESAAAPLRVDDQTADRGHRTDARVFEPFEDAVGKVFDIFRETNSRRAHEPTFSHRRPVRRRLVVLVPNECGGGGIHPPLATLHCATRGSLRATSSPQRLRVRIGLISTMVGLQVTMTMRRDSVFDEANPLQPIVSAGEMSCCDYAASALRMRPALSARRRALRPSAVLGSWDRQTSG